MVLLHGSLLVQSVYDDHMNHDALEINSFSHECYQPFSSYQTPPFCEESAWEWATIITLIYGMAKNNCWCCQQVGWVSRWGLRLSCLVLILINCKVVSTVSPHVAIWCVFLSFESCLQIFCEVFVLKGQSMCTCRELTEWIELGCTCVRDVHVIQEYPWE